MPPEGLEPLGVPAVNTRAMAVCGSNSVNEVPKSGTTAKAMPSTDPDLSAVVAVWRDLPAAVRLGIVAMVKAATNTK